MSISTSLNSQLEHFFRQHPDEWIDGRKLETIAGRYAWRTRVSDLRILLGMTIENRQRRIVPPRDKPLLKPYTISEYRYVPTPDVWGPSISTLTQEHGK